MIVDSSALIAAIELEVDSDRIFDLLGQYGGKISAATLVEVRVAAWSRAGVNGIRRLNGILRQFEIEVVAFDEDQADAATDAYVIYGRGSRHPAKLNLGDAFSYALAYVTDEPLLYVGDDFSRTDIRSAFEEYAGD